MKIEELTFEAVDLGSDLSNTGQDAIPVNMSGPASCTGCIGHFGDGCAG